MINNNFNIVSSIINFLNEFSLQKPIHFFLSKIKEKYIIKKYN